MNEPKSVNVNGFEVEELRQRVAVLEKLLEGAPDDAGICLSVVMERNAAKEANHLDLEAQLRAFNAIAFACLATSPEAQQYLRKELPTIRQALTAGGLNALQVEIAEGVAKGQLGVAEREPKSLAVFVRSVWVGVLSALANACKPSAWTFRGAMIGAGVVSAAILLASF